MDGTQSSTWNILSVFTIIINIFHLLEKRMHYGSIHILKFIELQLKTSLYYAFNGSIKIFFNGDC